MKPGLQRGFTLIAAIFLIVVLAVLGVYMIAISGTQHHTTMLAGLGAQGYHAARAGTEWAAFRALNGSPCSGTLSGLGGTLAGYTVEVSCIETEHSQAGDNVKIWSITSTATRGTFGELDFVSRTLSVAITDA